jgi:hypothetical protein
MTVSSVSSTTNQYQNTVQDGFSQAFQDFKGIGTAIQSGDLTTAENALTAFQQDLQNSSQTSQKNPLSQLFSNNSTLNNDLSALQTALKSNDAAGAQTAFKTLAQDMQSTMKTQKAHHHHHHVKKANDGGPDNGVQGSNTSKASAAVAASTPADTSGGDNTLDVQA